MRQKRKSNLQVLEDVLGVGHAYAQHRVLGQHLNHPVEQLRQMRADVSAVRAGVLAGEPDLDHALYSDR